jgi:hypothetical protein
LTNCDTWLGIEQDLGWSFLEMRCVEKDKKDKKGRREGKEIFSSQLF